jgi:hypothetical protein
LGEWRYDARFVTSEFDGGEMIILLPRPLYPPGKQHPLSIGWGPCRHYRVEKNPVPCQHKNVNFPYNLNRTEMQISDFCCDNGRVQMGEMSKLGSLIGWSVRDMWADSIYFLYVAFGSICKTFASFQRTLWPIHVSRD